MLIDKIKDKIRERIYWREKYNKDPEELTEAEQWVKSELEYIDMTSAYTIPRLFGSRYSKRYFRTHSAEEAYEQWLDEIENAQLFLEELLEKKKVRDAEEKAEAERLAAEKAAKAEKAAAQKAARAERKRQKKLKSKG